MLKALYFTGTSAQNKTNCTKINKKLKQNMAKKDQKESMKLILLLIFILWHTHVKKMF